MKKLPIFAVGLAFLAACSSIGSGPKQTEDDSLKTRDSFCKAWANAACNEDVVDACQAADEDSCMAAQKDHCIDILPAGYDSTNAEQCIAAVKRAFEDAELNQAELDLVLNLGGDCSHLVHGGSPEGSACTYSTECNTVRNYSCVVKPGEALGTCQVAKLQSAGQSCDGPEEVCAQGYYCVATKAGGGICGEQGTKDTDSCEDNSMCIAAMLCDPDTSKCAPKLARSVECTEDSQCASGICLLSAAKPKCVDAVILTPEASACESLGG